MKSPYYVASTVKAYREAIDDYFNDPDVYEAKKDYYLEELQKNSHRKFTTGFYYGKTDQFSQVYENNSYIRTHDFVGIVLDYDKETELALVEQRNKIVKGDTIEIFSPIKKSFFIVINEMYNAYGNLIEEAPHAQQIIKVKIGQSVNKMDILRIAISQYR